MLYAKKNAYITNRIYQDLCKTSERTALRDLESFTEQNILVKTGEKKRTKYNPNWAILAHEEEIVWLSPHLFGETRQFLNRGYPPAGGKRYFVPLKPLNLGIN